MDIVEQVAAEIAEIPGDPSSLEIARVAIEAYQKAIWPPAFDTSCGFPRPWYRKVRADQITAHIMNIIGKHLCDHGGARGRRDVAREIVETLYESGADIITDADRAAAGLQRRGPCGLTIEEIRIIEARRMEAMLRPMPPFVTAR